MRIRRIVSTSAAALSLVLAGTAAGAAIAGGPVDGSGVIHGCYATKAINGSHVFVLQDAGSSCPNGTTAITWNQTGPPGPAGPSGTVSSLDDLDGIPCAHGRGTTYVSYGVIIGPGNPNFGNTGTINGPMCIPGVPTIPQVWGTFGCGDSTATLPDNNGNGPSSQEPVEVPYISTAGPTGDGTWWTVTGNSSSDQNSPPNCVYQGMTIFLTQIDGGTGEYLPATSVAMDVYPGNSYTGQAPVATNVTSYSNPNGGTFLVNIYPSKLLAPGNSDIVGGELFLTN